MFTTKIPPSPQERDSPVDNKNPVPLSNSSSLSSYLSNYPQVSNIASINNHIFNGLKNLSPRKGPMNLICRSPSFFLNCAPAKPSFWNNGKTPPSDLGSTYVCKQVEAGQSHEASNTRDITSFDSYMGVESSGPNQSNSKESSPILCKEEAIEEEKPMLGKEYQEERFTRRTSKKEGKKESKKKMSIERERSARASKREAKKQAAEEHLPLTEEELRARSLKFLDQIIKKLKSRQEKEGDDEIKEVPQKTNAKERVEKVEQRVNKKPEDFEFESDFEEGKKDLLTEAESYQILSHLLKRDPEINFASEENQENELSQIVVNDEGVKEEGGKGFIFLSSYGKKTLKILSIRDDCTDVPLFISKKISKESYANYECKYCGKTFEKGCALGGHISRIHKGESVDFKIRQQTRMKRAADRARGKFLKKETVKQLQLFAE